KTRVSAGNHHPQAPPTRGGHWSEFNSKPKEDELGPDSTLGSVLLSSAVISSGTS
ncbi:hypothetical protein P7K49_024677, partial [Saguinus oedipus]